MSREADGDPQSTPRGAERPPPGRLEVDRHRRHLTVRRLWLQPRGHPHRVGKLAQPSRGQGLGPAGVPESRRFCELGHTQYQGRSEKIAKVCVRRRPERASHDAKSGGKTMAYQAEISRKNPGCFLFLVDQSESMEDPFGGGEAGRRKAEELATILNKLIHNLCIRCAKSDSIYDYFHVGVLGYSEESCKPALGGELSGRSLIPISELANKPLRIEERIKKSDDGAGGVMEQTVKFPVW